MIKEKLRLSQQDYEKIEQELKKSGLQEKQIDMILNDDYKAFNEGTELENLNSKGNNFANILGELSNGYTIDELQERGMLKKI